MTLSRTIQDALNEHMNQEFYASYLYLSMSAYCEAINLPGFAHWMRMQSQEEYSHAMKMFDFIVDQKGRVILHPIDQPTIEFHSPLDLMQQTYLISAWACCHCSDVLHCHSWTLPKTSPL